MVANAARTQEAFFMFLLLVVALGENEWAVATFPETASELF
jgi:hypothetical protein